MSRIRPGVAVTRILTRIGLGLLAVIGLYFTVIVGMVAAGVITGFASSYRKSPHVTIQYIHCTDAHPSAECAGLAHEPDTEHRAGSQQPLGSR